MCEVFSRKLRRKSSFSSLECLVTRITFKIQNLSKAMEVFLAICIHLATIDFDEQRGIDKCQIDFALRYA